MSDYKGIFEVFRTLIVFILFNTHTIAATKIPTLIPGIFAYEHSKGYYRQITLHDFPVIKEDPRPISASFQSSSLDGMGASVTIFNNWPERINNASIFPYLSKHPVVNPTKYDEFCNFVKDWYQTSCAIIYCSSKGFPEIIGSGSLKWNNYVSTARHNFEHIPEAHLFVRFFNYSILPTTEEMIYFVKENCLDIPIIRKYEAINGLDAGFLEIPSLYDQAIFNRYAKVLPAQIGNLSSGEYAMFHFAGGTHQISIGKMEECNGATLLHSNIAIQGGPGSSGAAVIKKCFESVSGEGISIYRTITHNGGTYADRRLIDFFFFTNIGATIDCISAPYYFSSDFFVVSSQPLFESGYEFLRWKQAYTKHGNDRPKISMFEVQPNHSNHHIIPRGDLLYLWNYIHDMPTYAPLRDRLEAVIHTQVDKEALQAKQSQLRFNKRQRFEVLYAQNMQVYENLQQCLKTLCLTFYDHHINGYHVMHEPIGFYWAWWNLFKGWESDFRGDDPLYDHPTDRSEKTKPFKLNKGLWDCLKKPNTGLHYLIQQLKLSSQSSLPDLNLLYSLYHSLSTISQLISTFPENKRTIHPFSPDEWEMTGFRNGHDLYKVKSLK